MRLFMSIFLALVSGVALGADCPAGSASAIKLESWKASKVDEATVRIEFQLTSALDKSVRMVQVETGFDDALGRFMGGFEFDPDFAINPGQSVAYTQNIGSLVIPRLVDIKPEDAIAYFCTMAVVYDDGTKEDFR